MTNCDPTEIVLDLDWHIAEDVEEKLLKHIPNAKLVSNWLKTTLEQVQYEGILEVGIRVIGSEESYSLNQQYRNQAKATNVLSFESELPEYIPSNFIGDLAICAPIVIEEAETQNKLAHDHWAHLCIHGLLHLLGYDHITESDAEKMESAEIKILAQLGIDDPYQIR
ncbi:rRNA maturation RNase YbeY [Glaciecola petra]|uniref:Endoribonuclease YbeY n=1 Tax=Glaciecola petra TaxID=3075602 RepID=A0ABU2ZMY2_9ALTE|nr:rRNA maturation RNase YbeY [Aestuariibacter sp. P117]MDT0593987.1 rRNA maturation RNase YbeY [Aestuariibacter sp. P117]